MFAPRIGLAPRRAFAVLALLFSFLLAVCARDATPNTPIARDGFRQLTIETPNPVRGAANSDELARALLEVGREAGVELRGDGRLAELAAHFAESEPVGIADVVTTARAVGLADAALVLQRVKVRAADLLPAALRMELPAAVQALRATHFGVQVLPTGDVALVMLSRRPFVLDAVPERVAAESSLHLRGRRAADVQGAKLVWCDPYELCRAYALGSALELDVRLPVQRNGSHRVELREQSADGERTVLAFTVAVGDGAGRGSGASEPEAEQLAAARAKVLSQLGALRSDHGLEPFADDPPLTTAAAKRCSAADTAQSASDEPSASVHGGDAAELYEALAADPGMHAHLLSAEHARLGLALCWGAAGLHAVALLAARVPGDDDAELASGRVLVAINAHRRAREAGPLRPDSALTEVAQRAATALLGEHPDSQNAIMERANAELEHYALRYRRVAAVAVVVHDAIEAATLEPALDLGASVVGIATATLHGSDPKAPNVAVILALGWER